MSLSPTFLSSINALLVALALPFNIEHPTDLTPSLLLAIFESLISARLPIPTAVRQSRTRDAKARAMLVLLGVLECDVLRGGSSSDAASNADDSMLGGAGGVSVDGWVDEIGLGEVDPEQLADGGWEETIFVGELLCWLARRKGILPRTKSSRRPSHQRSLYSNHYSYGTEEGEGEMADFSTSLLLRPASVQKLQSPRPSTSIDDADTATEANFSALSHITDIPRHPLVHSPEPSLSASATTGTDLSIRARSVSSHTSVSNARDDPNEFEEASQDTIQTYDPLRMIQDAEEDDDRPPMFRPHCIHELEDPSYIRAMAGPSTPFDPSASHDHVSEQDVDDLYEPPTPTPRRVRLNGWIEPVDSATELSQFATSRVHSRSRAFNASAHPLSPYGHTQPATSQWRSRPEVRPRTPRRMSPPPSPSPSPSPTYKRSPTRLSPNPPPSPPSPPADPDPPFDVSFTTLNNTSTPAKPRPLRRSQLPATSTHHTAVDRAGTALPPRRRDRSPSYTPSPPSFSASGSSRGQTGSRTDASVLAPPTTRKNHASTSPPSGSTATTNTLLTERARLLTELAALKRARSLSNTGTGPGMATRSGSNTAVGRRVGVGV